MLKRRLFLCGLLSISLLNHVAHAEATKEDAIKLVNKAHEFLKAKGRDKLIEAVNIQNGEFHQGDLYVFVSRVSPTEHTIIAHPVNPKLVGKNTLDVGDVDGKLFRKEFQEIGLKKTKGWVDYKYKNPETGKIEQKTSYVLGLGDLIIVCGIYK